MAPVSPGESISPVGSRTWAWAAWGLRSCRELAGQAWQGGWLSRPPKCQRSLWSIFDDISYGTSCDNISRTEYDKKEWSKQPSTSVIYKTNIWNHWISLKSLSWSMIVFFFFSPFSFKKSAGESPTDPARGRASRRVSWGWRFINVFPARLFTGEKLQTVYEFQVNITFSSYVMGKDMKSLHLFWSSKC